MTEEHRKEIEKEAWTAWEQDQLTNPNPMNPHDFTYGYKIAKKKDRSTIEAQEREINSQHNLHEAALRRDEAEITALKSKLEEREAQTQNYKELWEQGILIINELEKHANK